MLYYVSNVVIFILLTVACIGFFYYLQKKQLVENTIHEVIDSLEQVSKEQARELRRNVLYRDEEERGLKKIYDKPRKRFIYARIDYLIPGLTIEIWIIVKIIVAAALYFVANILTKSFVISIITVFVFIFILLVCENIMAIRNYKRVDANLVKFIDLLGNYSVVSGDITGVLHRISSQFVDPLKSVMEECYFDAQTSGDTSTALYSMAEKIEHPKFKELIRNIESSIHYAANFQKVVEHSRKIIMEEQRAKRERESVLVEAIINFALIGLGLLFAAYTVGKIVGQSLEEIFLESEIGNGAVVVISAAVLGLVIDIIKMER